MNDKVPDFEKIAREVMADITDTAAVIALNFFKGSFEKQGWTDTVFTPWPGRKSGDDGRALLVQTASLRESIRIIRATGGIVEIGTSDPKAVIHNNGGTITVRVTDKSRRFFWYMYRATKKPMWKWMALTKKDRLTIYIPQRQFIGESQALMGELDDAVRAAIIESLKKHFK